MAQIKDLLQKCKSLATTIKVRQPGRYLPYSESERDLPAREVADTMVALYFQYFETTYRILHRPTFWTEYERYWDSPESVTTEVRLKILLVIGIGSSLSKYGDSAVAFNSTVQNWVYNAQAWLSGPLKKDRLDITGLQIHCLTIQARQIFSIGGDLVWVSMGSLMHQAMQIGLHRDPKHIPSMSILEAEVRRRLWATILEMVVQSSLDSAMPPRISFDEFDTEAPSNNSDNEMDGSTAALQPHPKGTYTETSTQLLLLDSLPIRLRVLQLLTGLHSELSFSDVLSLSAELTDAYRACGSFIAENEKSGVVAAFQRNMLHYLVHRFMIPLHYPFASKARTNPVFHYSLKASLDAAMVIVSPEPDDAFSRIMAIGGGMFREGIRLAATTISLELIAQVESQRLDGTLRRNSRRRGPLKRAVKDVISLFMERVRQGDTNVKNHTLLSMVLAYIEAIETGASSEFKVAQSAKESLELCYSILQTRASSAALQHSNDMGNTSTSLGNEQDGFELDLDLDYFFPDANFT